MFTSHSQGSRGDCRRSATSGICLGLVLLAATLTACGDDDKLAARPSDMNDVLDISPVRDAGAADPGDPVTIRVKGDGNRITDVTLADAKGRRVRGELTPDGKSWRSRGDLAAGISYTVTVNLAAADGSPGRGRARFRTAPAKQLLHAKLGPARGTYGVGQPLTAELNHPVTSPQARAVVERGLRVTSRPAVRGSWHWIDDHTLHYRPEGYWPTHATVHVASTLSGVKVQRDLYGGPDGRLSIRTGDRIEALVDAEEHTMTVSRNGKEIRRIPVTTGKPGFETRNGVKVILAKQPNVRMAGTSIGIPQGSPESYDLDVHWATQVTLSGEYLHAAPWSEASQGVANVSHGCTGMSMEAAEWFFTLVRPGDIVTVVGSDGDDMAPFGNGFGDWNLTWNEWRAGSALNRPAQETTTTPPSAAGADQARLRPLDG